MPKLLLVEDDLGLQEMLCLDLWERGYEVTPAHDCRNAEALLKQQHFDVALLDYHLPDGNGLELIAQLRSAQPTLAIIMSSGDSRPQTARRALQSGAMEFVLKPASIDQLDHLFRQTLGQQRDPTQAMHQRR
jgi:DNA-binding response OmpR family regulator